MKYYAIVILFWIASCNRDGGKKDLTKAVVLTGSDSRIITNDSCGIVIEDTSIHLVYSKHAKKYAIKCRYGFLVKDVFPSGYTYIHCASPVTEAFRAFTRVSGSETEETFDDSCSAKMFYSNYQLQNLSEQKAAIIEAARRKKEDSIYKLNHTYQ